MVNIAQHPVAHACTQGNPLRFFVGSLFLTYSFDGCIYPWMGISSDGCIYPWMGMSSDGCIYPFWSYINSKGQEWIGVGPLKNKMGFLQNDNKSKAGILNEHFQSVFTKRKFLQNYQSGPLHYNALYDP
jgi:hypothetical protein